MNHWLSLFMLSSSMVRIIFRPISLNFFSISLFPLILQLGSGLHLPIESLLWHLGQLPSGRLSKIVDSEATTKAVTIMISRSADFISSKKESIQKINRLLVLFLRNKSLTHNLILLNSFRNRLQQSKNRSQNYSSCS